MFSISLFRLSSVVRPRKRMVWRPWNTTSAYCFRECPRIPREKLSPLIVTWMTLTSTSIMETSASSVNKIWSKSVLFTMLMFCFNCLHCFRDIPKLMLNQSFVFLSQSFWISESDDGETVWSGRQLPETFRCWIQRHQGPFQHGWKRGAHSWPG